MPEIKGGNGSVQRVFLYAGLSLSLITLMIVIWEFVLEEHIFSNKEGYLSETLWQKLEFVLTTVAGSALAMVFPLSYYFKQSENAEKALVQKQRLLDTYINNTSDWLWETDRNFVLTYMSYRAQYITGYTPEEMKGRSVFALMPPEEVRKIKDLVSKAFSEENPVVVFTHRYHTKEGAIRHAETKATQIFSDDGTLIGYCGTGSDITEKVLSGEHLAMSEQRLQDVMDHTTSVIFVKDLDGRYLMINRRFEQLFNVKRVDVLGKTDFDLFEEGAAIRFRENDQRVLKAGYAIDIEEDVPHFDGVHYYISTKFPLCAPNGAVYGVCGIATDITAKKGAEKELKRFTKELVSRQETERKKVAEELHESIGQNVVVMKNEIHHLAEKFGMEHRGEFQNLMDLAEGIIWELKTLSYRLRPPAIDTLGLEKALTTLATQAAEAFNFEVTTNFHLPKIKLPGDTEINIFRILQETLTDIARHSDANRVTLTVETHGEDIALTLIDNGLHRSGKESKHATSALRDRVQVFGGTFTAESLNGRGRWISIRLPAG